MHYLRNLALVSTLLLTNALPSLSMHNNLEEENVTKRLENALNSKDLSLLTDILTEQDQLNLKNKYSNFITIFPNANWRIIEVQPLKDGRRSLEVMISGEKQLVDKKYTIQAKQVYAFNYLKGKIIKKEGNKTKS